jgi:glycosyltransferase involved in cell wall biosynthesis
MMVSRRVTGDPSVADAGTTIGRLWGQLATHLDVLPWRFTGGRREEFSSLAWVGSNIVPRVQAKKPDLVQLHWICAGFLRIEALARLPGPLVWRLADMWAFAGAAHYVGADTRYRDGFERRPAEDRCPDLERAVFERKRRTYARIDDLTVVTPSRWLARCAAESRLLGERRIEIIPTGQDLDTYRPIPTATARELLRLPPDVKLVMAASMGLGERRKGVRHLLDALETLRGSGYRLLLLGDPPATLPTLPVEAHWLGKLTDDLSLALAYSAADVFVAPSLEENLANTVIEAMACGVPCVAFDIGGMPDIVRPGVNGYLARPYESTDLARGIVAVLEAGEGYARLAAEARATVEREFSEPIQARRYAALYAEILESRARRAQAGAQAKIQRRLLKS